MQYGILLIIHLLCAAVFIGIVAFEVLILEGIRRRLPASLMAEVEAGIHTRARRIMPWIIAALYLAGLGLASFHAHAINFSSAFGILLSLKILLALSVLIHFISAMKFSLCGQMNSRRFKRIHHSVFIHLLLIAVFAKAMFYI